MEIEFCSEINGLIMTQNWIPFVVVALIDKTQVQDRTKFDSF
jgi:hypothetical protein